MPARTCARRPATRTMKNSSRLFAEIDRNLNRSMSGCSRLADSRTRRLKPSHDSSRLMKRSGLDARSDAMCPAAGSASQPGLPAARKTRFRVRWRPLGRDRLWPALLLA